jgi:hypothetical protein
VNDQSLPGRYVDLCLRVDTHVEGFVDAFIGPPSLRGQIAEEEPHHPSDLRDEALALLDELPGASLEEDRVAWLTGQLRAIECVAARLSGEDIPWSDEAERCFGIRPKLVDEEVLRASHKKLDEVLPGSGDLSTRYNGWIESAEVPRDKVPRAIEVLNRELQRRAGELVDLPSGESVEYEIVTGEHWQAFNLYRGDSRSLVQVNVDLPYSVLDVLAIVAHESYPGHHTERTCKEKLLYRDRDRVEMSVMITDAPEAMIAEGIAMNAVEIAVGNEGFGPLLALTDGLGVHVDVEVAEAVYREEQQLWTCALNAARMLHEDGSAPDDVSAYLQEWALYTADRADKVVSFIQGTRAYVATYIEGKRLCSEFIESHPDGLERLLTQQLTVSSLLSSMTNGTALADQFLRRL